MRCSGLAFRVYRMVQNFGVVARENDIRSLHQDACRGKAVEIIAVVPMQMRRDHEVKVLRSHPEGPQRSIGSLVRRLTERIVPSAGRFWRGRTRIHENPILARFDQPARDGRRDFFACVPSVREQRLFKGCEFTKTERSDCPLTHHIPSADFWAAGITKRRASDAGLQEPPARDTKHGPKHRRTRSKKHLNRRCQLAASMIHQTTLGGLLSRRT